MICSTLRTAVVLPGFYGEPVDESGVTPERPTSVSLE
jgi:hypothetical protein